MRSMKTRRRTRMQQMATATIMGPNWCWGTWSPSHSKIFKFGKRQENISDIFTRFCQNFNESQRHRSLIRRSHHSSDKWHMWIQLELFANYKNTQKPFSCFKSALGAPGFLWDSFNSSDGKINIYVNQFIFERTSYCYTTYGIQCISIRYTWNTMYLSNCHLLYNAGCN